MICVSAQWMEQCPIIFQFKMADSNPVDGPKAEPHVLPFKRKAEQKSNFKSATDEEDIDSAPSLKSSSNPPLPELQREKRKLQIKALASMQAKGQYGFVEKEVRQHDNILLKQRNNLMANENVKLKTRITVLEKQNERLNKLLIDNENSQLKPTTAYNTRDKPRPADNTLRAVIRGLRKEIEDLKKENVNIKSAVKFTSLKELESERDQLAEETIRLRLMLEEEQAKRTSLKANFQGVNALEHRLHQLSERNSLLSREHNELLEKCKKLEESAAKASRAIENQKALQKAITGLRKTVNDKEVEIEQLRGQLRTSSNIGTSNTLLGTVKDTKFEHRRPSIDRKNKLTAVPARGQTKSAQKPNTAGNDPSCNKCPKLEAEIQSLNEKVKQLQAELEKGGRGVADIVREPIQKVTEEEVLELRRFLTLRFKAHRLTYEESQRYLVNCEGALDAQQRKKEMAVRELMESLFVEPFCIVSNRYLEVLVVRLVYGQVEEALMLDESKKATKGEILAAYSKMLPKYEVMSQEKEEEMFIQVAELITTYYQQIMAALTAKRNGEGTIPQKFFLDFFREIELEQDYIDFIITQIILESLDMEHLNFYAMFEIFYMPQMNPNPATNPKKKKFQVANQNVVHEEDQEYEQSKSHLGSRNKTVQHKQQHQEDYGWEQDGQQEESSRIKEDKSKLKQDKPKPAESPNQEQEYYQEEYEEEKMENEVVEPKAKSYVIDEEYDQ